MFGCFFVSLVVPSFGFSSLGRSVGCLLACVSSCFLSRNGGHRMCVLWLQKELEERCATYYEDVFVAFAHIKVSAALADAKQSRMACP